MKMHKRTALFTLLSPLHHGSERPEVRPEGLPKNSGENYTPHRKIPISLELPDNTRHIVHLPAVSGNHIRHKLRELLVDPTLQILGLSRKDLSKSVLQMFTNGGGMDASDVKKNEKGNVPLLVRSRETLRAALPPLSLFGASYGNRMLEGLVNVGWAIPALKETEHITGVKSEQRWNRGMTSYQILTRSDTVPDENEIANGAEEGDEEKKSRQAIYYVEVVSPGLVFTHWVEFKTYSTPIERAALQLALDRFKDQPYLGGKSSIGQGLISTDQWYEPLDEPAKTYLQWLDKHKETIRSYILLWDKPEELARKDKKGVEWPADLAQRLDDLIKEREEMIQQELEKEVRQMAGM